MTRTTTALFFSIVSVVGPVPAEEASRAPDDARAIIEQAFAFAKANEARAREYVFHERVEERRFGKKGEDRERQSWTFDVTLLDHSEHRRLIARNDQPLGEKAAAKEQRKLDKQLSALAEETPKQRRKRLSKMEKERQEGEEFLHEITRAFDFRGLGEAEIDGVPTHVIGIEPKAGYAPPTRQAKVLTKLRGTLWIAQDSYAWVKADLETLDSITWRLVLRLHQGARFGFRQRRHHDEVWLMESWYVRLEAKAALVWKIDREYTGRYSNFRRFSTESTIEYGAPADRGVEGR